MSNQIETWRIIQFSRTVQHLAQQRGSRLRVGVDVDNGIVGKRAAYDQLDKVEANQITTRHGDTEYTEVPFARRNLVLRRFDVADLVDETDRLKVLNDPVNPYSEAFMYALGRKIDDQIIQAADGVALTGEEAATSTAFNTAFSIASGTAGMTVGKWMTARQLLEAAEETEDEGPNQWYIAMSARQRRDLLATTEVTSGDFNTIKALVNGQINQFLGMIALKTERLGVTASERAVLVWNKSGIKLGIQKEPMGSIDPLPGKRMSIQVWARMDVGATRMRETAVVRIFCTET